MELTAYLDVVDAKLNSKIDTDFESSWILRLDILKFVNN